MSDLKNNLKNGISEKIMCFKKEKIKIRAFAKINIGLDISSKRPDGYHSIDTVMQTVSIADRITVRKAFKVRVDCGKDSLKGEKNIAFKAAKLFLKETRIKMGAHIKIKKHIPLAAGLGGGSADAAAVLLALDKLYKTRLSYEKLCELALELGADVPFFIGGGTQRAEGIGERLTPLKTLKKGWFLLIKNGDKPSTKEMYSKLDSNNTIHPDINSIIKAVEDNDLKTVAERVDNSFIAVNQPLEIKDKLLSLGAVGVSLSGSGPTWYAIFEDENKAVSALKELKKENVEAYLCQPLEKSIIFE